MSLINDLEEIKNETDLVCYISGRANKFTNMLKELLLSGYKADEDVWFCGTQYNLQLPSTCWRRPYDHYRVDMMFRSSNYAIPIELKTHANDSALSQIKRYMSAISMNVLGLIVTMKATQKLKEMVKEEDDVVLVVLEEGKLY